MTVLVDSHVLVFWLQDPAELRAEARAPILNGRNRVLFSAASVWELSLKQAKGKLTLPEGWVEILRSDKFEELPVTAEHALESGTLPPLHADPFDRLLLAQARVEGAVFITRDGVLPGYGITTLRA